MVLIVHVHTEASTHILYEVLEQIQKASVFPPCSPVITIAGFVLRNQL